MKSLLLLLSCTGALRADVTFLMEEPYGIFGALNPTGHAAVYFSRVCADTPVVLRRCAPSELGVVISRYYRISGYDWLAIPLIPYLYAVERLEDVPEAADSDTVAFLREEYRRKYLRQIVPDRPGGHSPEGAWIQLIGAAYNRKIYGFQIRTTEAQDDHVISELNSQTNKSHFNLFWNNCADFSRRVLNLYYPGAVRRNFIGDAGITTPIQIAKCLIAYTKHHPGLLRSAFFLPQVAGSRKYSHRASSVCEALVKSKKYIVPLAAFHPWVAGTIVVAYLAGGHFNTGHYAETRYRPSDLPRTQPPSSTAGMR